MNTSGGWSRSGNTLEAPQVALHLTPQALYAVGVMASCADKHRAVIRMPMPERLAISRHLNELRPIYLGISEVGLKQSGKSTDEIPHPGYSGKSIGE